MSALSTYQNLTFEDATRIIYYHYGDRLPLFKEHMEELLGSTDKPHRAITPKHYDEYRDFLKDNQKEK